MDCVIASENLVGSLLWQGPIQTTWRTGVVVRTALQHPRNNPRPAPGNGRGRNNPATRPVRPPAQSGAHLPARARHRAVSLLTEPYLSSPLPTTALHRSGEKGLTPQ